MRYRFGRFELQPDERRLLSADAPVPLGAHALDILIALAERGGRLVTKDELLRRVWGAVVVEENTLQVHVSTLRKVLGAESIATVAGHGYRFTVEVTDLDAPAPEPPAAPKHNLPYDLTSFIGREKELAELAHSLRSARLVTLTGAGGCGKTRLAIRLAHRQAQAYPDGVWLVELAALVDAALLPLALAGVLGLKEKAATPPMDAIAEFLSPRAALLVLDNAEHVVVACAELAETLLRSCERLVVLVTSREPLSITGELVYRVPSLSVPASDRDATPEVLEAYEAPRLFVERAKLQRPQFEVTTQNAPAIASICRRLDGIALALELAAPVVRTLSVEELDRRLESRFEVLTQGSRTALPRHRTLRALIDWSYQLLDEAEQAMLRRASVFFGGWALDAAEYACPGGAVDATNTQELLGSLVEKSLIVIEAHGNVMRYGMLETVRQYASEQLRDNGEAGEVHRRHLAFLQGVRDAGYPDGVPSAAMVDRCELELDNIRAALSGSLEPGADAEAGLRLAGALLPLWQFRSKVSEGRRWLSRLRAAVPEVRDEAVVAKALIVQSILAYHQDDYAQAEACAIEGLSLCRKLGDRKGASHQLANLGSVARHRGQHAAARALYEECLGEVRELGDHHGTGAILWNLGLVTCELGDYVAARTWLVESATILTEWRAAFPLATLAMVDYHEGDLASAKARLEEALRIQRDGGVNSRNGTVLILLAIVAQDAGDIEGARDHLAEALKILPDFGSPLHLCEVLEAFAAFACVVHGGGAAARFWGAAERGREEFACPIPPSWRSWYERQSAASCAALGDDVAFGAAWAEGRAITLDQAVKYAVALVAPATS